MFYYLEGTVALAEAGLAVIDCGGVGYACNTSLNTVSAVKKGEKARLYTYLHIREDIFDIYGFATQEELNCFKMLIAVSGVGPKAAVSILSAVTPERLAMAIINEDEKQLTAAQGIGRKIAQRIILELKDKMRKAQGLGESESITQTFGSALSEAETALAVLGYGRNEIRSALSGVDTAGARVEDIIRAALKNLTKL
ncbi:MAG: Holliday junction branch migration protein RuvA [Oscillospiraceae bacterium]|jgi:Holliday junction DNA helicase RuvA|nr:Holliday junction branch migration protein RuvA [Oscillospiraceae bacterium]